MIGLETQTVTISFMGSAAYIAALNQLQAKLGCRSRARLAMAALDALATAIHARVAHSSGLLVGNPWLRRLGLCATRT